MQTYSETIFGFLIVFYCDPNFGIGDSVAGTTPVALIEQTLTFYRGFHLPTLTDELVFHQQSLIVTDYGQSNMKSKLS